MGDKLPAVCGRSQAAVLLECPTKVFGISIADIPSDGFYGVAGGHQPVAGGSHPLENQVLVGSRSDVLTELGMQI